MKDAETTPIFIAAALALLIAVAVPRMGSAQPVAEPQLQAFTRSEFYKGLLSRILSKVPEPILTRCPTLVSKGSQVTVMQPVSFAASGYPNAGVWKQSFPISGCG